MSEAVHAIAVAALVLALLPLVLTLINLPFYRPPTRRAAPQAVSVLIPARDEAATIRAAVEAALSSREVAVEVVVLDDHSEDDTATIVSQIARGDPRVRLHSAPPLPHGWSGKQHACHVLAGLARNDILLFQDADVRLAPDAASSIAGHLAASDAGLVSGFPRQVTGSLAEKLMVPQMLFLLLGYLPLPGLRWSTWPAFGAACGQLIAVRRDAYRRAGGHAAIRTSLHDGLKLPRAFRRARIHTDLVDATNLATCRMYRGWEELRKGFTKNATEGMATPRALPVWTLLLFGGHILPWLLLPLTLALPSLAPALPLAAGAAAAGLALRFLLAVRFRQSLAGALLHPIGVALLLGLQWAALLAASRGRPSEWRGRVYPTGSV